MHKNVIMSLLCQYWLFIHTSLAKNSVVSKHLIFYLLWYNVIRWSSHICKKSSFLAFYSFLVKSSGNMKWQSESITVWQSWMGWKTTLCKWHTFWMVPCLICYFIVISFFIEKKRIFIRNSATILPLKSKLFRKFQRFNAIDGRIKMLINNWISKNFA